MFKKLLKEEIERVVFQYIDEVKTAITVRGLTINEFMEDIEIELEALESYDYHSIIINHNYKKPINQSCETTEDENFKAFYKDFYDGVKDAFVTEIKLQCLEYAEEIEGQMEDLNYFKNKKYVNDIYFGETESISEGERLNLMDMYKKEIKHLENKINVLNKAL